MSKKNQLHPEQDPETLLGDRKHPRGWKSMTYEQKLEYIANRILAEDRHGVTSHEEIKQTGILSISQYERRRSREVYTEVGHMDGVSTGGRGGTKEGVFSRVHARDLRGVRNTPQPPEGTPPPTPES